MPTTTLGQPITETGTRHIYLDRGMPFVGELCHFTDDAGDPVDISTWTFTMDIRQHASSGSVVLSCTVGGGQLDVDQGAAAVSLSLSAAEVDQIGAGGQVYDLKVERPGLPPFYAVRGRVWTQIRSTR